MKKVLKKFALPFIAAPLLVLKLFNHLILVRTFLGNQSLFGHLSLEPEKYLNSIDASSGLAEIGFIGEKLPENICVVNHFQPKAKIVLDLWTFGRTESQANKALVKMWKRNLHVIPSHVMDIVLKANSIFRSPPIYDYRFSTLLSADKYLDETPSHLAFTSSELESGRELLRKMGIPTGAQYVCVVTREGGDEESSLRNRDIGDLIELIQALTARGLFVIRLGDSRMEPLEIPCEKVIDYARSELKSPEGDIYIVANCLFMVSTMTGPDALALAFRKRVLLIDISHYGLVFSGTKLVTWVPSILNDGRKNMSIEEVFKCGAGWFWKDSQFRENGITVSKSTPTQISEYGIELLESLNQENGFEPSELQKRSQYVLQVAMGDLGDCWHGKTRALIPNSFLNKNKSWFIA